MEPLILMLAPIAPHICEEMWSKLGHAESLSAEPWPVADERYVGHDTVTAVVQIKGKVRARCRCVQRSRRMRRSLQEDQE